jgi:hypothetical protein
MGPGANRIEAAVIGGRRVAADDRKGGRRRH